MISISKRYDFDAAHQLNLPSCTAEENHKMFGKCNNLHGHTYSVIVEISGPIDSTTGMIMNYFDLDKIVKPIIDGRLDHTFLNEVFPDILTTAEKMVENIAEWFRIEIEGGTVLNLESVTLSETPKTTAKWTRE